MAKNLFICFDGTWSEGKASGDGATNVWRLFQLATENAHDCTTYQQGKGSSSAYDAEQIAWYDAGVGTAWYERLRGGLFGYGLNANILQGYAVLAELYEAGDKIFLCGFSRGAYTARSLAGLIAHCGLVHRRKVGTMLDNFPESTFSELMADACAGALTLYRDKGQNAKNLEDFREQYTRKIDIECIAVWDTVKALGLPSVLVDWLPFGLGERYNDAHYGFHNHSLSPIVRHGYHALALDEHRQDFAAILWDAPVCENDKLSISNRTEFAQEQGQPPQIIEQRWFCGSHSDVGGGYESRALSEQSLLWMCDKLRHCGLHLQDVPVSEEIKTAEQMPPLHDSFRDFYKLTHRWHTRHIRPVHADNSTVTLDPTVLKRIIFDASYRPQNDGLADLLS